MHISECVVNHVEKNPGSERLFEYAGRANCISACTCRTTTTTTEMTTGNWSYAHASAYAIPIHVTAFVIYMNTCSVCSFARAQLTRSTTFNIITTIIMPDNNYDYRFVLLDSGGCL